MKNNKYLCYTILLLIISLFYFLFNARKTINTPYVEYILALFLVIVIIFSILFWSNPIKKSKIHKIDSIIAKIVILSFIIYTLLYKFKFSFLLVLLASAISFYFSNYYSKQEWLSDRHLFYHGLFHIFCFIATLYTFSPI